MITKLGELINDDIIVYRTTTLRGEPLIEEIIINAIFLHDNRLNIYFKDKEYTIMRGQCEETLAVCSEILVVYRCNNSGDRERIYYKECAIEELI